jgi:Fungalysin metallopeptidase (M36)/IPT/TIG domain/Kelch motif
LIVSSGGADLRQEFAAGQSFERDVRARLVYFPLAPEQVRLAWEFVVWMRETPDVYLILIDAEQNNMLFRQNLTNYEENPLRPHGLVYTQDSPRPNVPHTSDSPPTVEREDLPFKATPFNGGTIFQLSDPHYDWWAGIPADSLISNNTDVRLDRDATLDQPDLPRLVVPDGNFSFPVDLTLDPTVATNPQAAQVNLFYWINRYHDILYSFGFNEAAGNFQTNNFGLGGVANDAVIGDTQDGLMTNNATFSTPPDGQPGRVQMFLWTTASPRLDGSFDQGVIIHELTHGLSNRLVGNALGLGPFQSGSMGEGWSDFLSLVLLRKEQDDPNAVYPVGGYLINDYARGIRRYPYSTNMQINPLTFKNLGDMQEVHAGGEIWCSMLWEMRALLIGRYGFREGQQQSIQLVIDGLKMTPTFPTFIDARDAILLADRVNNQGANQCLIWQAFAKRGMGFFASTLSASETDSIESFDIAPSCSALGSLRLDKRSYVDNETVHISLGDSNATVPVMVNVTSSKSGDRERIKLEPDASIPGLFNGSIRLDDGRVREGDGRLQGSAEDRDQIRVDYWDRDTDLSDSVRVRASAEWTRELVILDDNVERGNQTWLTNGSWTITSELSGSPTHSWRIRGMNIDPVLMNDLSLTSPLLDLTGLGEVTLSFSQSRQFTSGVHSGRVEISVDDGVTWTGVASFTDSQTGFAPLQVPLRGLDGQARARLRFLLVIPQINLTPSFWAIDDIRLSARSADPQVAPPDDTPVPIITAISPAFGPPGGGTQVMISGANFTETDDTVVTFDDAPAAQMTVLGSTTLTAVTPAHSPGPVNVRVTNRRGSARQSRGFTYYEAGGATRHPVLGNISPVSGSVLGGTAVTLTGMNFTPETTVLFGSQEAPVTFVNGHTLRAVAPAALATGVVDVTVRNGSLQMTRPGAFRYVEATPPAVQVLSPQGGESVYTGSLVTIRWQSSDNREVVRHRVRLTYLSDIVFPPAEQTINIAVELGSDSRSYTWQVPTGLPSSAQARIYVTAIDDEGAETEAVSGQFAIVRRWETRLALGQLISRGQYVADDRYLYGIVQIRFGPSAGAKLLRFDPETNIWTDQGLAIPPSILGNAQAVHLNGKIYIPGGSTPEIPSTPLHYAYDIAANTWSTQAEVPVSTALYAVAADNARGVYYRTGGITPTNVSAAVRMYDPSTNTWTDLPPMKMARFFHNAAVIEGKLYVAGGLTPAGDLAAGEVYDFETGQWSPIAPPNRSRVGARAAVVKDAAGNPFWLFVGGMEQIPNDPEVYEEVYDVRNNQWIQLDDSFILTSPTSIPGGPTFPLPLDGSGVIGGFFYGVTILGGVVRIPIDPLEMSLPDRPPILTVPVAQVGAANREIKFKV